MGSPTSAGTTASLTVTTTGPRELVVFAVDCFCTPGPAGASWASLPTQVVGAITDQVWYRTANAASSADRPVRCRERLRRGTRSLSRRALTLIDRGAVASLAFRETSIPLLSTTTSVT